MTAVVYALIKPAALPFIALIVSWTSALFSFLKSCSKEPGMVKIKSASSVSNFLFPKDLSK